MPREPRSDIAALRDMLEAGLEVLEFTRDKTWSDYQASTQFRRSVERSIEIIGEAARSVSDGTQAAHPEIAWGKIIPARHRLAHEYDRLDDSIVWSIAVRHVPTLVEQLRAILPPDPVA